MTSKTTKTRKFRPSPAMIVSCLALCLALAGTAVAAPGLAVRSAQIVNGTIRSADLGTDSVRSPKIADATVSAADLGTDSVGGDEVAKDAIGADEIAKDAVTAEEIAKDAVGNEELAADAVGSGEVADQSLTQDDLGPGSVGSSELQTGSVRASELGPIFEVTNTTGIAAGENKGVSVACPAGSTVISGGAQPTQYGVEMTSLLRSGNGWLYQARNNTANASTLKVFAYCLAGGSSN